MLKYPCLVLDHDDTVVRSEETVNFPAFLKALAALRPGVTLTQQQYALWTFQEGFCPMCENHFHLVGKEFDDQYDIWKSYVMTHTPPPFEGIGELLWEHKKRGGLICVSSHSSEENICRDYMAHFGFCPDEIYGWELGEANRKPAPFALDHVMKTHHLSPNELLVVDDLNTGLQMAHSRNVAFAWVGWGRPHIPEIAEYMTAHSDFAFYTVSELEKFLFQS